MELEFIPVKQSRQGKPSILFAKTGLISFSKTAVEKIGLGIGSRINIARDKNRPQDWYLIVYGPSATGGIKLRGKATAVSCNVSSWTKPFLEQFSEGDRSVSCLLATEGDEFLDGSAKSYAILTKSIGQ
jgi:hypothetical protein